LKRRVALLKMPEIYTCSMESLVYDDLLANRAVVEV
jgi:hypothetical protein